MPRIINKESLPRSFDALNKLLPLRPINDRVDFDNAEEVLDRLLTTPNRNKDQDDYFTTLTTLMEKYEADHDPISSDGVSVLETLKYLMEGQGMTASDLGRLLGERTLGTKILSGTRGLSKAHITKLADHFKVGKALFIE